MFKSVFQKIFVTYLSILILVMVILSLIMTSLAQNYVYTEKEKMLGSVAQRTNSLANDYASGEIDQTALGDAIDAMAYITDTKIYIVETDESTLNQLNLGDELNDQYLKDALKTVMAGDSVFLRRQYSKGFEAPMLFVAYPWQDESDIFGAVLLFSPESQIASIIDDINLVIMLTAAAFVLIGGLIVYVVTKKTVAPIQVIDDASKKMAAGRPVGDIEIRSKDELGNMARSFNSMRLKLEKNEQLRQDLIANISHDLRTPLTNINGYISGIADGIIAPEDFPKYIGVIQQEARRLMRLTGEILDTAKIQSGNIELNISRFKLAPVIDTAIAANAVLSEDKHMTFIKDVDGAISMRADREKIQQVLYNLINNAVKYSEPDTSVDISARQTANGTEICVTDHGKGISHHDLPHIFDRFYRAETKKSGYGLGLCIAKTYVESHSGCISAQSGPEGTRICFVIP